MALPRPQSDCAEHTKDIISLKKDMESSIKIKQGQIDFTGLVLPYKSYVAILNQTIIK